MSHPPIFLASWPVSRRRPPSPTPSGFCRCNGIGSSASSPALPCLAVGPIIFSFLFLFFSFPPFFSSSFCLSRRITGGVLGHGAVQEEIRFVICPELLISCLLCEKMGDRECVVIKGAERFSNYSGYS